MLCFRELRFEESHHENKGTKKKKKKKTQYHESFVVHYPFKSPHNKHTNLWAS